MRGDRSNPAYFGYTCAKGRQLPLQHAHPDRLLYSQKRQADGSYASVPSEGAMDEIAQRVSEMVERHGPRSVAIYIGTYSGPHPASAPFSVGWLLALGSGGVGTGLAMLLFRHKTAKARVWVPALLAGLIGGAARALALFPGLRRW